MKKKSSFILILLIFKVAIGFGQIEQLMTINYKSYIGKPVDSLVNALPSGYISITVVAAGDGGAATSLKIIYQNNVRLYIDVQKFKYMNPAKIPPGSTNTWDVNLFRKETIAFSILYNNDGCLLGCDNECYGCPAISQ